MWSFEHEFFITALGAGRGWSGQGEKQRHVVMREAEGL